MESSTARSRPAPLSIVGPAGCGSRSRSNDILFFGVMIILAVRSRPRAHAARLYHSIRTVALYSYASPCSVSQRSHCLRSRPATPTAVFATAPAPEAANDSAIAASARRSSAEGSVADDALSAASSAAAKPRGPLPLGLRRRFWKTTDSSSDVPRPISQLYLRHPAKPLSPLVGRKCRPPLATRLPSSPFKTSIFFADGRKDDKIR